jgi:hypothetical protein
MIDLWPDGIEQTRIRSPVTILREQGSLLGRKTKNLVQGEVLESASTKENQLVYSFFLVAPALSHYRYKLLTTYHDAGLYPVQVDVEDGIMEEVDSQFEIEIGDNNGHLTAITLEASSEENFLELLRQIFRSKKVKQVVTGLLSQSDPSWQSHNGESSAISLR